MSKRIERTVWSCQKKCDRRFSAEIEGRVRENEFHGILRNFAVRWRILARKLAKAIFGVYEHEKAIKIKK